MVGEGLEKALKPVFEHFFDGSEGDVKEFRRRRVAKLAWHGVMQERDSGLLREMLGKMPMLSDSLTCS